MLNTRLYRPIAPVLFTNEITRGKKEYLRGLARRLEENPVPIASKTKRRCSIPSAGPAIACRSDTASSRGETQELAGRFVAKDHVLIFTSNGQVHHSWSKEEFRQRTRAQQDP